MRETTIMQTTPLPTRGKVKTGLAALPPATVDREFFSNVVNMLATLGVDFAAACRQHNVANPLLVAGDRLPLELVSHSYDAVNATLNFTPATYARVVASMTAGGASRALYQLLFCCATVGEALTLLCRYATIVTDVCTYSIRPHFDGIELVLTPARGSYVLPLQIECAMYFVCHCVHGLLGGTPAADGVHALFASTPQGEPDEYRQVFACSVQFNQPVYALRLRHDVLAATVPGADERKAAYLATLAERHANAIVAPGDLPQRVQHLFLQHMSFGEITQERMAEKLNLSLRTLQRQLLANGTSYRELVESVRLAVAVAELRQPQRSAGEVALMLGYTEARCFFRAFRRWTGTTPGQWRASSAFAVGPAQSATLVRKTWAGEPGHAEAAR